MRSALSLAPQCRQDLGGQGVDGPQRGLIIMTRDERYVRYPKILISDELLG